MKTLNDKAFITREALVTNPEINPRHKKSGVEDLKARIARNGFISQIWLRKVKNKYEIIDGSRRVQAVDELSSAGVPSIDEFPARVFECTVAEAQELALAANVAREGLHPADEAEAFYKLKLAGIDVPEIAVIFAKEEKLVKQRIAIGSLHPKILEALRAGDINLETAQAFTVTPSQERQLKIFKGEQRNLNAWNIRRALTEKAISGNDGRVNYITLAAYEAAGGKITTDLFSNGAWLDSEKLLQKLVDEKLEADVKAYKDEGWSFVTVIAADSTDNIWNFSSEPPRGKRKLGKDEEKRLAAAEKELKAIDKKIDGNDESNHDDLVEKAQALETEIATLQASPYTANQKAELGIVISVKGQDCETKFGVLKPGKKKPAVVASKSSKGGAAAEAAEIENLAYSETVNQLLAIAAHHATKLAMVQHKPIMAARLALAHRTHDAMEGWDSSFREVGERTSAGEKYEQLRTEFLAKHFQLDPKGKKHPMQPAGILVVLETMQPEDIATLQAFLAADDFELDSLSNVDAHSVFSAIDPPIGGEGFGIGADFIGRLNRAQIEAIAHEIAPQGKFVKGKRGEMAMALLPMVESSGWLPQPLRTPSYQGPGSASWAEKIAEAAMPEKELEAA
ncbi:ParB/RepB/Spo0J family partition protein [Aestuariivirga litoralis]|uniref:ParB/RepB/Spo0J family partition protein n=1 Tax=Aestuariivirga litoralis TaxID=2650924 RepID=UPI0018C78622|nr:ParB/RepB/Spo0J family partition protein [Aestuariivirga litoralis]